MQIIDKIREKWKTEKEGENGQFYSGSSNDRERALGIQLYAKERLINVERVLDTATKLHFVEFINMLSKVPF